MNKHNQTALLKDIIARVQANMLAYSSQWPDDWDGYELRWLVAAAFDYEKATTANHRARYKAFRNIDLTTTLY